MPISPAEFIAILSQMCSECRKRAGFPPPTRPTPNSCSCCGPVAKEFSGAKSGHHGPMPAPRDAAAAGLGDAHRESPSLQKLRAAKLAEREEELKRNEAAREQLRNERTEKLS